MKLIADEKRKEEYNTKHGITPASITRSVERGLQAR
jgi:excinuclease UvrABC helicase subunit UvrB